MAEYLGSLFGGEKAQAPVVDSDDGMFSFRPTIQLSHMSQSGLISSSHRLT